jgi:cell division protein FtsX
MYLLKLSLRPWRLAPLSQIFSAAAVGFLLLLTGVLFWMQSGLRTILVRLQGEQVVTAYIDTSVDAQGESKLVDSIRGSLGAHPSSEVKLVAASDFVQKIKNLYPDLARELEDLGPELNHVVPRYISVSGMLPDSAVDKIKNIPGIEAAESSKDRYHHIVGAFRTLRWVARVLMGGICLALLTGLIHLSRMNAYLHRDALSLLRFWGATHTTLAAPGMISGTFVGLLGGLIASAGWITVGAWLTHHIRSFSSILKAMPSMPTQLALTLLVLGAMIGFVSGVFGSISASHLKSNGGFGG